MVANRQPSSSGSSPWNLHSGDVQNLFFRNEYTGPGKVIIGNGKNLPITHTGNTILST